MIKVKIGKNPKTKCPCPKFLYLHPWGISTIPLTSIIHDSSCLFGKDLSVTQHE